MDISPGRPLPVLLQRAGNLDVVRAQRHEPLLQRVGRVETITVLSDADTPPDAATALIGDMQLLVPMAGLIDVAAERQRLEKLRERTAQDLARSEQKLANPNFVSNAPGNVVEQERDRVTDFKGQLAQVDQQLEKLDRLQ